ncbi:restriction endonuclease subunit S [Cohnella sp. AR92]|uniref:restriction endonuclease subunit S n=1 Tax=Cohnella sp. AR92 TaxID=648716 RepID=UPI000F8F389B|nr:restriction endonuclease subunit S [Cohnella sp. AR92]RUS44561.1 restriction endonuclease subunit S [Cohnella sp. AR92]
MGRNIPRVRFKEFDGDWNETLFDEIFDEVNERTSDTEKYPLYSLTLERGVTPKSERYDRSFLLKKEEDNYKLVKDNDFVYNPMNLTLGAVAKYNGSQDISVSGYYNVFRTREAYDCEFFERLLRSGRLILRYKSIATGSLIEKQRVHFSQFVKLRHPIPSLVEQKKIGKFFSLLDKKIEKQQEKIEQLGLFKKGMLRKIFSQELRFKDDDGQEFPDWVKTTLRGVSQKITKKNTDFSILNVISNSSKHGLVSQRDYFDKDIANTENIDGYYVIENGDFVYNPRVSNDSPYGPINIFNSPEAGIVSPLYLCFRVEGVNKTFLSYYFKSSMWHRHIYEKGDSGARHDRVSIKDEEFFNMSLYIPSIKEQEKIVRIFDALDKKITAEKLKLDLLVSQKLGFMQEMFI